MQQLTVSFGSHASPDSCFSLGVFGHVLSRMVKHRPFNFHVVTAVLAYFWNLLLYINVPNNPLSADTKHEARSHLTLKKPTLLPRHFP